MTCLRSAIWVVLSLALLLSLQPAVCQAMDPRFELDTAQIKKETVRKGGKERKNGRRMHVRRSLRPHHRSISLRSDVPYQNQSSAAFRLVSASSSTPDVLLGRLQPFWKKIVPSSGVTLRPLAFKTDSFELSIDPVRYPLLQAADGGKLLIDPGGTLPPLVRTLIQAKDPSVRIISISSMNAHQLLGAMLAAGGFYSVEEQPVMTFGVDPQLKVRSDFKVERTAESVMRNEVLLVSASHQGLPVHLTEYLKNEGFELFEPFADQITTAVPVRHRVVHAIAPDYSKSVDLVLESLDVPVERNRRVELFHSLESGIGLSVTADRYFERDNKRFVVVCFTGDPVAYTLFRLLETKGYRVVILEPHDGFKTVASKLLSRMDLPASYAPHLLVADSLGRYSIQMSGFMLENASASGGALILTDRPMERSIRDLLYDNGYLVQDR